MNTGETVALEVDPPTTKAGSFPGNDQDRRNDGAGLAQAEPMGFERIAQAVDMTAAELRQIGEIELWEFLPG